MPQTGRLSSFTGRTHAARALCAACLTLNALPATESQLPGGCERTPRRIWEEERESRGQAPEAPRSQLPLVPP
jgi:hypothetical protein